MGKMLYTEQKITDTLESNYMPYAMSVIISRAIPEIDGFKPAHRKLLYTMYKMGLLNGDRTKSTNVVGQTMKLNPHGDATIYETMVRLARGNEALLHPFVDSKGNFGKNYSRDMAYAASRYTEVKLDNFSNELFRNIDKNTVDFIDNYDGTLKEPVLFPTTFPNVLVTPNKGIAVGMASNICSFNLKEVCSATIHYIKNKNADIKKYLKAPDFSTGGELIYREEEIDKIYETGRGSFKVRGKYRYDKKNSLIEIYEIPYTTNIETIVDQIIDLVKKNKIKEINDVRNETDLGGLKITLDIKKSANPELLMNKLFSMTTLEDSFSCNFNILVNGSPKVMGVKQILDEWLIFRRQCIKRQCAYDLEKKREKHHLLTGLSKILLDIDRAIKIVRETQEDNMVIPNLMEGFDIDEVQAEYVAEIKLRNLNKEYILNLQALGTYQIKNAKTAVEVALVLDKALTEKTNICDESDKNNSTGMKNNINNSGNTIEKNIKKGIEKTVWPGRMEVISKEPLIIIDGAHNPGAVLELRKTLDLYFTNKRITFIMGVLSDKDFSKEAEIIADRAERIITITPNNSRGLDGHRLAETLVKYNHNVQVADSLKQAAEESIDTIKENKADMILAFGSLSYLGELKQVVRLVCNH